MSERVPSGLLIDGCEVPGAGSAVHAIDPRSGSELPGTYADATPYQVGLAAAAAAAACGAVADAPAEVIAGLLSGVADELTAIGDAVVALADAETGLGPVRLRGELARTTAQLRLFAGVVRDDAHLDILIEPADPDAVPPRPDLRRMRVPLGPVAVFGASNFPLAFGVAGGDTASALAARCPVIAKAHPAHPGTSAVLGAVLARQVEQAGLPAGTVGLVHGADPAVSRALVAAPQVSAVGFTGSTGAGLALTRVAQDRPVPIPVYAEMGSLNPVVITPAALVGGSAAPARALAASVTAGWGQFCTKPGLVVLPAAAAKAFTSELIAALAGAEPGVLLTAAIAERLRERADELDAHRVAATEIPAATVGHRHPAVVVQADAPRFLTDPRLREETFGPALVVVAVTGLDEAVAVLAAVPGSLTGTLWSGPPGDDWATPLIRLLLPRVGRLLGGGVPTGVAVTAAQHHGGPFPATTSAQHTSVGPRAIDRFTRPVAFQDVPDHLLPAPLTDAGSRSRHPEDHR